MNAGLDLAWRCGIVAALGSQTQVSRGRANSPEGMPTARAK
jgi:hypothetical protein